MNKGVLSVHPTRVHGLLFDMAVFAGWSLILFGVISIPSLENAWGSFSLDEEGADPASVRQWIVGAWLLGGIVFQNVGALLKGPGLRYRLAQQPQSGKGMMRFLSVLWFAHFMFFLIVAAMALTLLGWEAPDTNGQSGMYLFWGIAILVIGSTTTLVVRATSEPSKKPPPPSRPYLEYIGDFLLWVSVLILTRVLWDPLSSLFTTGEMAFEFGFLQLVLRGVLFLGMLYLFVVFYLPARLLFLVEDGRDWRTWVQMGIVLTPLVWHIFFG